MAWFTVRIWGDKLLRLTSLRRPPPACPLWFAAVLGVELVCGDGAAGTPDGSADGSPSAALQVEDSEEEA